LILILQVGEKNPKVELYVYDYSIFDTLFIDKPLEKVGSDHILGTVFWISNQKFGAIWLNRRQNEGVIVSYTLNQQLVEMDIVSKPK
jgi:hypothetical protein